MTNEQKQYAERDPLGLDKAGGYYIRHVMAMTAEGLHAKSNIAAELAWRDAENDKLRSELSDLRAKAEAQAVPEFAGVFDVYDAKDGSKSYIQIKPEFENTETVRLYTATPAQAVSVPEGYEIVHSGEIAHLRRNFAVQIGCERGEAHYWQGDGQDFPDSLACPVVMHANTLREMLSMLSDLADAAEVGMACIIARSPRLKLSDPVDSTSWNCPEYDGLSYEVKRARAMLAAAPSPQEKL